MEGKMKSFSLFLTTVERADVEGGSTNNENVYSRQAHTTLGWKGRKGRREGYIYMEDCHIRFTGQANTENCKKNVKHPDSHNVRT